MRAVVGAPRIPAENTRCLRAFPWGGGNAVLATDELERSDGLIRTDGRHRLSPSRYPAVLCHGWQVLD